MFPSDNKRILAIAPHADDAEIGMGGTIARLVKDGYEVKIIDLIIPCENSKGKQTPKAKELRIKEAKMAAKVLGAEIEILDLDPYAFGYNRENIKLVDQLISANSPGHIFMTWEHDSHQDHNALARIMFSATRKNNCSLYMYETMLPGGISTHSFRPQLFIDISSYIEQKKKGISSYRSVFENNKYYVDAITGRAAFRGSQIGVQYAEAFEIVKEIIY